MFCPDIVGLRLGGVGGSRTGACSCVRSEGEGIGRVTRNRARIALYSTQIHRRKMPNKCLNNALSLVSAENGIAHRFLGGSYGKSGRQLKFSTWLWTIS